VFRHHRSLIALAALLLLAGCEGARNNSSWSTAKAGDPIVPPLTIADQNNTGLAAGTTATSAAPEETGKEITSGRGIGPVDHVDISKLDAARALKGSEIFTAKCSACHKIDERYIGPALIGVTKRRTPEWICNQILNPENMIQQDPTAKALLAQYIAPMANQHLTLEEAESVLAFFIQNDAKVGDDTQKAEAAGTPSGTKH
jgi:mono/diheme cytochrome c family protein